MSDSAKPSLHIRDIIGRNEGDWPTEAEENGNYLISCHECGKKVTGPKRALHCYTCYQAGKKIWDTLTPVEQRARTDAVLKEARRLKIL